LKIKIARVHYRYKWGKKKRELEETKLTPNPEARGEKGSRRDEKREERGTNHLVWSWQGSIGGGGVGTHNLRRMERISIGNRGNEKRIPYPPRNVTGRPVARKRRKINRSGELVIKQTICSDRKKERNSEDVHGPSGPSRKDEESEVKSPAMSLSCFWVVV